MLLHTAAGWLCSCRCVDQSEKFDAPSILSLSLSLSLSLTHTPLLSFTLSNTSLSSYTSLTDPQRESCSRYQKQWWRGFSLLNPNVVKFLPAMGEIVFFT